MITIERREQSGSRPAPFSFGDVVIPREERFVDIRHSEVIYLPDGGYSDAHSFQLARRTSGAFPFEPSTSDWSTLKRVGRYGDLPGDVMPLLQPYRRGIVINGFHWDTGAELFEEEEVPIIRALLKGDATRWDDLALGTQSLYTRYFGVERQHWRVFTHRKESWSTWEMHGPSADEGKARRVFVECIEESKRNPPRELRRGVYENTGQINVVVLYQGCDKRDYWSFLVGQGEAVDA